MSIYNTPILMLRDLLAESETWQEWVDCETSELAAEHVYPYEVDDGVRLPYARIDFAEDFERTGIAAGAGFTYRIGGSLTIDFEAELPLELANQTSKALLWMADWVGRIQRDMELLSGRDTRIAFAEWRPLAGPLLSRDQTAGKRCAMMILQGVLQ